MIEFFSSYHNRSKIFNYNMLLLIHDMTLRFSSPGWWLVLSCIFQFFLCIFYRLTSAVRWPLNKQHWHAAISQWNQFENWKTDAWQGKWVNENYLQHGQYNNGCERAEVFPLQQMQQHATACNMVECEKEEEKSIAPCLTAWLSDCLTV